MNNKTMVTALEARMNFIFEKWNESYKKYDEVNIGKEKFFIAREDLQSKLLCNLAGKGGA